MRREDEHDVAALCHLCNAIPIWGLIICGAIWLNSRERSRYLVAQVRQAMYFHGLLLCVLAVWAVVELFTKLLQYLIAPIGNLLHGLNFLIITAVIVVYIGFCIWGCLACAWGIPFRYPLVGERTE